MTQARNPNGTFPKGVSGNPDGLDAVTREFRNACKAAGTKVREFWESELEVKERIVEIGDRTMVVEDRGKFAMESSKMLAAYGFGKPTQPTEVTGANGGPLEVSAKAEVVYYVPKNGRET